MLDTRTALLQALVQGESYGLELIERIREMTNGRFVPLQGSVYPVLRELEREGLLSSHDGAPLSERGGRPRRYYELTAEGRRVARHEANAILRLLKPALRMA